MRIALLGAGAWGTALAISLSRHHQVTLWARDPAQIEAMRMVRANARYLPEAEFPESLSLTADLGEALAEAELALVVVPIAGLRATLESIVRLHPQPVPVVWACKGFEPETAKLPHQVVAETLPESFPSGVLSGPSFAVEVARGLPTALTLASSNEVFARTMACALHHERLRIYASSDLIGVEVGGAIKNVMAIATGVSDGLGFGYNARAALISRGLAEMTRLGIRLGGRAETLGGLSGAGDLILTCTGDLSRNRKVGMLLAQGRALPDILHELGHVAEGVYTAREVHRLSAQLGVEMPICDAVYQLLYGGVTVGQVVDDLLRRAPNSEFGVL